MEFVLVGNILALQRIILLCYSWPVLTGTQNILQAALYTGNGGILLLYYFMSINKHESIQQCVCVGGGSF